MYVISTSMITLLGFLLPGVCPCWSLWLADCSTWFSSSWSLSVLESVVGRLLYLVFFFLESVRVGVCGWLIALLGFLLPGVCPCWSLWLADCSTWFSSSSWSPCWSLWLADCCTWFSSSSWSPCWSLWLADCSTWFSSSSWRLSVLESVVGRLLYLVFFFLESLRVGVCGWLIALLGFLLLPGVRVGVCGWQIAVLGFLLLPGVRVGVCGWLIALLGFLLPGVCPCWSLWLADCSTWFSSSWSLSVLESVVGRLLYLVFFFLLESVLESVVGRLLYLVFFFLESVRFGVCGWQIALLGFLLPGVCPCWSLWLADCSTWFSSSCWSPCWSLWLADCSTWFSSSWSLSVLESVVGRLLYLVFFFFLESVCVGVCGWQIALLSFLLLSGVCPC